MRKEYLRDAACVIAIGLSGVIFYLANSTLFVSRILVRLLGPQERHGPISSMPDYGEADLALMAASTIVGAGALAYLLWNIVTRELNARRDPKRTTHIR
jgi:hypothetical protein